MQDGQGLPLGVSVNGEKSRGARSLETKQLKQSPIGEIDLGMDVHLLRVFGLSTTLHPV